MTFSGLAHVAINVRDMQTSVDWYRRVLDFETVTDRQQGPPGEDDPRILLRHQTSGVVLGIHEPVRRSDDLFDPNRTGLDHFALTVADRSELDTWSSRFAALDVDYSPVRDAGYAEFVSVFDPDGIQWEIWWAKPG